jgi:hypothetical protein
MKLTRLAALLLAALPALACTDDPTGLDPIDTTVREATISSNAVSYVALEEGPVGVTVADPATSTAWDVSLNTTNINTNTRAGISVHCLCGNAAATNGDIALMTPGNQLAAFTAVTDAQIPHDSLFVSDVFAPALTGWFTGTGAAAPVDAGRLLLLRRGTANVTFVKVHVTAIAGASASGPASVTLEYAVQLAPGAAFDTVRTVSLAAGARFEFTTRTAGTATEWDLQLDGWSLKVNSGVSGAGSTLGLSFASPFAPFTAATAAQVQPTTFRRDGVASQFGVRAWYRYNVTGTDQQIWPTYNIYLVKRGSAVYKVQLTGYYNLAGEPRNITIRSARIR